MRTNDTGSSGKKTTYTPPTTPPAWATKQAGAKKKNNQPIGPQAPQYQSPGVMPSGMGLPWQSNNSPWQNNPGWIPPMMQGPTWAQNIQGMPGPTLAENQQPRWWEPNPFNQPAGQQLPWGNNVPMPRPMQGPTWAQNVAGMPGPTLAQNQQPRRTQTAPGAYGNDARTRQPGERMSVNDFTALQPPGYNSPAPISAGGYAPNTGLPYPQRRGGGKTWYGTNAKDDWVNAMARWNID